MSGQQPDLRPRRVIGLLHPGEMGAAIGAELAAGGHEVLWAAAGRRAQTRQRAAAAGLTEAGTVAEVAAASSVILSICPPAAAADVADAIGGFDGIVVDANAIAPATARRIGAGVGSRGGRFVDGGIIGLPPAKRGDVRLYLAGADADEVAGLFAGSRVEAIAIGGTIGSASALKAAYAGWTKGTIALLLTMRDYAEAEGVGKSLLDEWQLSQPDLPARHAAGERAAGRKGWRWIAEMNEIADALAAAGLPDGFHRAAAAVYGKFPPE